MFVLLYIAVKVLYTQLQFTRFLYYFVKAMLWRFENKHEN